ncbi:uncharacterized protein LOC119144062 [Falco rusticolus]|uniref:uncharacterized protein LOC119144062 n=1 Tax=Falco rusticolus TaxID=120794 RepID=UPI0018867C04|nr:uncharacterized protein LOC119144062 [Falco rusticolus]
MSSSSGNHGQVPDDSTSSETSQDEGRPAATTGSEKNKRLRMPGAAVSAGATSTRGMQAAPAHAFPRFCFTVVSRAVAKALSAWAKKAAAKSRLRQGAEAHPGKLLQRRRKLSLAALPSQGPGTRQKDLGKKTSESALPPRPGSSPRMKEAGRQEPASPAKPTSTLPSSDDCQKALQEVWQLPAEWEQVRPKWQEQLEQAKAEWAAWGAWSAGKDRQQPQLEREHRASAPGRQPCSLVLAVGVSPCTLHLWRKGTEEEQPGRDLPEPAGERAGHPAAHGDCREQLGVASGLWARACGPPLRSVGGHRSVPRPGRPVWEPCLGTRPRAVAPRAAARTQD